MLYQIFIPLMTLAVMAQAQGAERIEKIISLKTGGSVLSPEECKNRRAMIHRPGYEHLKKGQMTTPAPYVLDVDLLSGLPAPRVFNTAPKAGFKWALRSLVSKTGDENYKRLLEMTITEALRDPALANSTGLQIQTNEAYLVCDLVLGELEIDIDYDLSQQEESIQNPLLTPSEVQEISQRLLDRREGLVNPRLSPSAAVIEERQHKRLLATAWFGYELAKIASTDIGTFKVEHFQKILSSLFDINSVEPKKLSYRESQELSTQLAERDVILKPIPSEQTQFTLKAGI